MADRAPLADLVERMLAAEVPHDVVVLAVRTAENFSAILHGENAEKMEKRRAADRERNRRKYQLAKVSKASGKVAGHKDSSAKASSENCGESADKPQESVLLSSSLSVSQEGFTKGKKKEQTEVCAREKPAPSADDWPIGYEALFWNGFPKKRRYDKPQVMALLAKLRREKTATWAEIYGGVLRYSASSPGDYAKAPLPWLRGQRWEVDYKPEGNGNGSGSHGNRTFQAPRYAPTNDDAILAGVARYATKRGLIPPAGGPEDGEVQRRFDLAGGPDAD